MRRIPHNPCSLCIVSVWDVKAALFYLAIWLCHIVLLAAVCTYITPWPFWNHWWVQRNKLILKTIGNRKGDCAWSCSRWQTQPEKICKSQRTNQCHSLRTLYWFVRCDLQIFSGCVCHLEQLHAQSPFQFPIVFSINLIPFFDICSVDYLLFFHPGCSGMCCFTWAAARSQQYTLLFVVLAALVFCDSVRAATFATLRQADHEWITRARARMSCMEHAKMLVERVLTRCSIFLAWSMSTK